MEMTDNDKKHIARIQEVRDSGDYNMFTEFYAALRNNYTVEESEATYEWVKDNWEYYQNGDWVDVDVDEFREDIDLSDDLPELSDREVVQLMAAQQTVMDHYDQLDAHYKIQVRYYAKKHGVDHELLEE